MPDRPDIATMSTDEKLAEILTILRATADALEVMSHNPILKGMGMSMFGKK